MRFKGCACAEKAGCAQACRSCAAAAEESKESRSSPARAGWRFSQAQIATLLMCYARLRCHPGEQVLMALTAQYISEMAAAPDNQHHCAPMLPALYCMGYDPGEPKHPHDAVVQV